MFMYTCTTRGLDREAQMVHCECSFLELGKAMCVNIQCCMEAAYQLVFACRSSLDSYRRSENSQSVLLLVLFLLFVFVTHALLYQLQP